jgi:hypothetical protein
MEMKNLLSIAITFAILITNANAETPPVVPTSERIPALLNDYAPVFFNTYDYNYIIVASGKRDEHRAFKLDILKMEVTESDVKTAANNHPYATNSNYTISLAPRFRDQPFALINGWRANYRYDDCDALTNICTKLILTLSPPNYEKLSPSIRTIVGRFDSEKKLADPQWEGPTLIFKSYRDDVVEGILAIDTDKNVIIKKFSNNEDGIFSGTYITYLQGWVMPSRLHERLKSITLGDNSIIVGNNIGLYVFNTHMKEIISCIFIKEQNGKLKTMKCFDANYTDVNKKEQVLLLQGKSQASSPTAPSKFKTKAECLNSLGMKIVDEYYEDADPKKDSNPKYQNVVACQKYK